MNDNRLSQLQQIFENVNNWLHFAEAKNAALIAFDVALMSALFSSNFSNTCSFLFYLIVGRLLIATAFPLWSFRPINKPLPKTDGKEIKENLLHYAYIASLDTEEYIKKLHDLYWKEISQYTPTVPQLERDYCEEIIQNSRITMRKQSLFRLGFYSLIVIFIGIMILIICA